VIDPLDELEAEALRLASGPSIADAVPDERERDRSAARERLLTLIQTSGLNRSEFAELLKLDESALRLVPHSKGIPIPWWLETLIREQPEFVAAFAAGLLRDVKASKRAKARHG
jgi:hypothetical protein